MLKSISLSALLAVLCASAFSQTPAATKPPSTPTPGSTPVVAPTPTPVPIPAPATSSAVQTNAAPAAEVPASKVFKNAVKASHTSGKKSAAASHHTKKHSKKPKLAK